MRALLVVLALAFAGCASARPPVATAPDTSRTMALVGRFGVGHGCPVDPGFVLTASHVVDPHPFDQGAPRQVYRWSDEDGHEGYLEPASNGAGADLAAMTPVGEPLAHWYEIAETRPLPGDTLWLVAFDRSSQDRAFAAVAVPVVVVRVVAGHVVFKPAGTPGSSGSCLLDPSGRVVGINVWGVRVGAFMQSEVGVAVAVWGGWLRPEVRR